MFSQFPRNSTSAPSQLLALWMGERNRESDIIWSLINDFFLHIIILKLPQALWSSDRSLEANLQWVRPYPVSSACWMPVASKAEPDPGCCWGAYSQSGGQQSAWHSGNQLLPRASAEGDLSHVDRRWWKTKIFKNWEWELSKFEAKSELSLQIIGMKK